MGLLQLSSWTLGGAVAYASVLFVVYECFIVVYRRFFHPLAKIPGPLLPAVTTLYQSYYNGSYFLEIERLHKKYGTATPRCRIAQYWAFR
jgi:hypothetical protein